MVRLLFSPDHFPCGAAHRAIRSPRTNSSSDLKKLQHTHSNSSIGSNTSSNSDGLAAESSNQLSIPVSASSAAQCTSEQDLAKRAQRRVIDHKRLELEKKHELEKTRLKKAEAEKLKKEKASVLKNRRRAEIYALNAIMKQIQQEKIAKFIASQKQRTELDANNAADGVAPTGTGSPMSMLHSIGV